MSSTLFSTKKGYLFYKIFIISLIFILGHLIINYPSVAQAQTAKEYRIKAGMVYNFLKFIEWPENSTKKSDNFNICVVGEDNFGAIKNMEQKSYKDSPIKVQVEENSADLDINNCKVVFINKNKKENTIKIIEKINKLPILTISDDDKFTKNGGIIELQRKKGKIKFEISPQNATKSNLKVSSKLLEIVKSFN